jgi:hypothetical protein
LPMGKHWMDIPDLVDAHLATIQARVEKAQPGSWYAPDESHSVLTQCDGYTQTVGHISGMLPADREMVLHASQDLRWCLDLIARLRRNQNN